MSINFISSQKQDCIEIAEWINSVGHGHIEYLFAGLFIEHTALQHLTYVLQQDEHYSYKNVDLAKDGAVIAGLVFSYSSDLNAITAEIKTHLSKDRIQWMSYFSDNQVENSWYINTLGVSKELRRQGIAKKLLKQASQRALKNGLQRLSLHVYENNHGAIKLYESFGFIKEKRVKLIGHSFFETKKLFANILMRCDLAG